MWTYQYDGRALFAEILAWCAENLTKAQYLYSSETIWISGDDAAMLFMLRWS